MDPCTQSEAADWDQKNGARDCPHKTVKFNSLRRGGLGNYGAWKKMLSCLLVGFNYIVVFDERRRMQREKERGRWGKERERCLSTWFNRHSLEIVKDEEVCLQKMQMGRSSGSKSSSWAVLRNLQCQQLPCTALLESPGNSYGWSSLAPGKVLPRGEGQILGEADPLGR